MTLVMVLVKMKLQSPAKGANMRTINFICLMQSKHYIITLLLPIILATSMSGCGAIGTQGANFAIDLNVQGVDSNGKVWRAQPDELKTSTPNPKALSQFPEIAYEGTRLRWQFALGSSGFTGTIQNKTTASFCVRFDQAMLTSNFQSQPVPMRVTQVIQKAHMKDWLILRGAKGEIKVFDPPKLCFTPMQSELYMISIEAYALFPSGNLFNINHEGAKTGQGIGNWLRIQVPVEYDGKPESMDITFKVTDSKLTISYH
jgi:hypothetical protein